MIIRNVTETKSELSALLVKVENGEDVVISRAGKPIARLVPYLVEKQHRKPGRLRGEFEIADDFDAWTPELDEMFYGKRP